MTPQQLLIPRYEVIADYPGRPYTMPIGHIITLDKFDGGKWWHEYTDKEPIRLDEGCTKYSANLRLLPWYHNRKIKEMLSYVNRGRAFYKVKKWASSKNYLSGRLYCTVFRYDLLIDSKDLLPCLESDYITFINREKDE